MRQTIHHLVGHEILNKTVYFVYHFNKPFLRNWRKIEIEKIHIYEAKQYIILQGMKF